METLTGPSIITKSGEYFNFLETEYNVVLLDDIAAGLSRICRFGGQLQDGVWYSVAEHSILCTELAKADGIKDSTLLKSILLHDASEAYCGDVVKPLKILLGESYSDIEGKVEDAIAKSFDVDFRGNHDIIKKYDIEMLYAEKSVLFPDFFGIHLDKSVRKVEPSFMFKDFESVKELFIEYYYELGV